MQTTTTHSSDIPAYRPDTSGLETLGLDNKPSVGDIVAIHSRGSYRAARVTRVTKTRIETEYTTESALKEAREAAARGSQHYVLRYGWYDEAGNVVPGTDWREWTDQRTKDWFLNRTAAILAADQRDDLVSAFLTVTRKTVSLDADYRVYLVAKAAA